MIKSQIWIQENSAYTRHDFNPKTGFTKIVLTPDFSSKAFSLKKNIHTYASYLSYATFISYVEYVGAK